MTGNEYQKLAARTIEPNLTPAAQEILYLSDKLLKEEDEMLYNALYPYGITKTNCINNINRIKSVSVSDDALSSIKRFYIDGKYAFTIKRVSTTITNKPTAGYTEGSLCYKVEKIIEDLEEGDI